MVPLALVGMSYREAPSAVRAALAAVDAEVGGPSQRLLDAGQISGVVRIESCARVEWLFAAEHPAWAAELFSATLIGAAENPERPGFAAQVRGHVAVASPWLLAGAALSGVVNTRDRRNMTQASVGPFVDVPMCFGSRRRATCPFAITAQAIVNLDEPYGFAGDGLRVWGAQAGLRWALWEPA